MSDEGSSLAFLHRTAATRGPGKRKLKVIDQLQIDLAAFGSDEEDDADYNVGEDSSNDGELDDSDESEGGQSGSDESGNSSEEEGSEGEADRPSSTSDLAGANVCDHINESPSSDGMYCCLCLNTKHSSEEMLECDKCGLVVHEECYGLSDADSVHSASSSCPTEPWFCDVCVNGVTNPTCELCPNLGGALKQTDCGRWVHLLCALYCGCTFADVDKLSPVCMFELDYERFGGKPCCLCTDPTFARTGICITCDAGMCKFGYFHVTCAQRMGLLFVPSAMESTRSTEADPYFANCPAHTDKTEMKAKRRTFEKLQKMVLLKQKAKAAKPLNDREKAKLERKRDRQIQLQSSKPQPWTPTAEKWPRLLHTNAEVVRGMLLKARLRSDGKEDSSDCTDGAHLNRIDFVALKASGKVVSVPLSLSADFIGYYGQRETDIQELEKQLEQLKTKNEKLKAQQNRQLVDVEEENHSVASGLGTDVSQLGSLLQHLHSMGRTNKIKLPIELKELLIKCHPRNIPASLAEDTKTRNGLKSEKKVKSEAVEIHCCATCKKSTDQHLLIECDTCQLFYHIACLDPPLTHLPLKTPQWGWECSRCGGSGSTSDSDVSVDVDTPRQLRTVRKPVQRLSISSPDATHKTIDIRGKSPTRLNGLRIQSDPTEPSFLKMITFTGSIAVAKNSLLDEPSTSGSTASAPTSRQRKRKASVEVIHVISPKVKVELAESDLLKHSPTLPNGVVSPKHPTVSSAAASTSVCSSPDSKIKRGPRRFVSRSNRNISEDMLTTAVNEVLDTGVSTNSVSKKYGIPKSTLRNHVLKHAQLRGLGGQKLVELATHSSEETADEDENSAQSNELQ